MKKDAIIILILSVLSLINWLPLVWYVSIYTLPPLSSMLLFFSFCSPFIAVIYIITAIYIIIFKETFVGESLSLESIYSICCGAGII